MVHNDVIPFYQDRGIKIDAILTDNGREFCGTDAHPYEIYLALNDIEHRRTKVRHPQTNGFVERASRRALDDFFRKAFREKFYSSVEELQADFDNRPATTTTSGCIAGIETWATDRSKPLTSN